MTVLEWLGLGAITALCLLAMFLAWRSERRAKDAKESAEATERRILDSLRRFLDELGKRK